MNLQPAYDWFASRDWKVFPFQEKTWNAYEEGLNGIVNAPTGSGKTYSLMMPILLGIAGDGAMSAADSKHQRSKNSPPLGRGPGGGSTKDSPTNNWQAQILPYDERLVERARRLRNDQTEGEKRVWKHLRKKSQEGYKFIRQKPLDSFIADFYCRELQLVVEVDGASHLVDEQVKKDKRRDRRLHELELNILRFDGDLVVNRIDDVIGTVQHYIECYESGDWTTFPDWAKSYLNKHIPGQGIHVRGRVCGFDSKLENPPPSPLPRGGKLVSGVVDRQQKTPKALRAIWITPIRALAKEIHQSAQRAAEGMGLDIEISIRTGDTSTKEKTRLRKAPPHILITTPETLHVLLAQKGYASYFKHLEIIVMDEWHELVGSKRGVQVELALSRLKTISKDLRIWGISATIGNMEESMEVLLGNWYNDRPHIFIKGDIEKKIIVESIFPDELETLPWSGHLGIRLIDKIIPILLKSESTLIFLNTRGQAEIWYQKLLEHSPDFAGVVALHHGSMSRETRHWVEDALYDGRLKVVICTSSLDLGVDFRPVETIIQVGGPKGVSRFMQRAGRSGHQPGATSKIYFLPTHSLELIEAAALREAVGLKLAESRIPFVRSFDVLIQYLMTLAVSDGFRPAEIFDEVRSTFCYESISEEEWRWCLDFIVHGGNSLNNYDEFHKVVVEDGLYKVTSKRVALRHRLSMGTIVSDSMLKVKFERGGYLGNVEEYFVSKLSPGDAFWFAGRSLELVRIKDMTVQVRKSTKETGPIPSWQGGRMPLSSQMSAMLRQKLNEAVKGETTEPEIEFLRPLIDRQRRDSIVPTEQQFLIEEFESKDGHHAIFYPFEGRFVHEGMAALLAYRISLFQPISFSIAMNDYGFELLSDQRIPLRDAIDSNIFSTDHLMDDILASVNSVEMARRRFRDIASISGLVFQGYPNKQKKDRHLQASSQLFFDVFEDYENTNLLLRQAYDEVMDFQLEEVRMRKALKRINEQEIVITRPPRFTPFAFPILVDRLREKLSSEKLSDRIQKLKVEL